MQDQCPSLDVNFLIPEVFLFLDRRIMENTFMLAEGWGIVKGLIYGRVVVICLLSIIPLMLGLWWIALLYIFFFAVLRLIVLLKTKYQATGRYLKALALCDILLAAFFIMSTFLFNERMENSGMPGATKGSAVELLAAIFFLTPPAIFGVLDLIFAGRGRAQSS